MNDVIDVESRALEGETRQMVVSETVSLPVPVEEVLRQWEQYQELTRKLLDDSDYQQIGSKRFKKKSAWRKYARAFNITDRVTFEEISRSDDGFPRYARVRVEARAMNGRTAEADQECHVNERCCETPCRKQGWKDHSCCRDCDGKRHWSHPGDLPATALTRAKNRAISDLIGAGEVSAEEMQGARGDDDAVRTEARAGAGRAGQPQRATPAGTPEGPKPECPEHKKPCGFRPAGTSAAGKKYSSFWSCPVRGCTAGYNGMGWSIFANEWDDKVSQARQFQERPLEESTQEPLDALPHE